jgi:hypothetical protein
MAKTTLSGKAARVLELLGGIATVRRARRALRAHGFKDEESAAVKSETASKRVGFELDLN